MDTPATKPDWIASSLQGQLKDTSQLALQNLRAEDFDLKNADDYWSSDVVKQQFKNDKAQFNEFYNKEKTKYDQTKESDKALNAYADISFTTPLAKQLGDPLITYSRETKSQDAWGRSMYYGEMGPKKYGWREKANQVGVRLTNGKYVPVTDFEGDARYAKDENGAIKINEEGNPYLEALKEGEEMRSFDESYNTISDKLGVYGLNQSSVQATANFLVKNPINFFSQTVDSLMEFPRNTVGLFSEEFDQSAAMSQRSMRQLKMGNTENQDASFWSFGSLADLGAQAALQLVSMSGVVRAAKVLGASGKNASLAGRLYMTGMSAGPLATISREQGLTPEETALMLAATSIPLYHISAISDAIVKGTAPKVFQQKLQAEMMEAYGVTIAKNGFNKSSVKSYMDLLEKGVVGISTAAGKAPLAQTAFWESIEETLEQGVDVSARALYDTIKPMMGGQKRFNIDWGQEFEMMVQSAAGGAIGGSVAYPLLKKMRGVEPIVAQSLEDKVMLQEEGEILSHIDKLYKEKNITDKDFTFMKEVVNTLVTIRERSGLKNAIMHNVNIARNYQSAIKASNIGKDIKAKSEELYNLESRLVELQTNKANEQQVKEVSTRIDNLKEEIQKLNSGERVSRYITEGLYNLRFGKNDTFEGRKYLLANEESISYRGELDNRMTARNEMIAKNDVEATADNYIEKGVSETGVQRILNELTAQKEALREDYDKHKEELAMFGLDPYSADPEIARVHSEGVGQMLDEVVPPTSPGYATFKAISDVNDKMTQLSQTDPKKLLTPQTEVNPDEIYLQDFNGNKSGLPLETILAQEELLEKNDGELYQSSEPERITKVILDRMNQVNANEIFKTEKDIINPGVRDFNATMTELTSLLEKAVRLDDINKQNTSNTDIQLKKEFSKSLRDHKRSLSDAIIVAGSQFKDEFTPLSNILSDLEAALDASDPSTYRKLLIPAEEAFYAKAKDKKDAILKALETSGQNYEWRYTEEGIAQKAMYDYMHGLLSASPATVYTAIADTIEESSGSISASDEQQWVALSAIRSVLASEYKYSPVEVRKGNVNYHNMAGIDGGPGSGKTSVVTPLVAGALSKPSLLGGKVILTSVVDPAMERTKNLTNAVNNYFGSEPSFIKKQPGSLIEILKSPSIDDVTLIVFDEATLLDKSILNDTTSNTLDNVHREVQRINLKRQNEGKTFLKIIYTYDRYQNSFSVGATYPHTITAPYVNIPVAPRLKFSFRSRNAALKTLEDTVRKMQDDPMSLVERKGFTYDGLDGVTIVKSEEELTRKIKQVAEFIGKTPGSTAMYITTTEDFTGSPAIAGTGIQKVSSVNSQGLERDYIILDDKTGTLFDTKDKMRSVYTGLTRAKKGIIIKVSPDTPFESIAGKIVEYTPIRPAEISRKEAVEFYTNSLTTPVEQFKQEPLKEVEITKQSIQSAGDTSEEPEIQKPVEAAVVMEEKEDSLYKDLIEKALPKSTWINTFFTTDTNLQLKRDVMFNPVVIDRTNYMLTIAPIGSEGFVNINRNDDRFNGQYGIFIEAFADNQRTVLGVLKDSDEAIRNSPLFPILKSEGKLSVPISGDIIKQAVNPSPIIENTNKSLKFLEEIYSEKSGIVTSDVYIATADIPGYVDDSRPAVKKGEPFVVLSAKHSKGRLDELLDSNYTFALNGKNASTRTLRLDVRKEIHPLELMEYYRPLVKQTKSGKYILDKDSREQRNKLQFEFWGHEQSKEGDTGNKGALYKEVFADVKEALKDDTDVQEFLNWKDQTGNPFKMDYLLEHYVIVQDEFNGKDPYRSAIEKLMAAVMTHPKMRSGDVPSIRYNVMPRSGSTGVQNTSYAKAFMNPRMNKFLTATYDYINMPQLKVDRDALLKHVEKSTVQQTPQELIPVVDTAVDLETGEEMEIENNYEDAINPQEFINNNFKNDTAKGFKALKLFRSYVINSMIITEGGNPGIISPNGDGQTTGLHGLKSQLMSPGVRSTTSLSTDSQIKEALGKNFNRLLAWYFPAIRYNRLNKSYDVVTGNKKTDGFTEKDSFNLLTDGTNNIVKTYLYNTPMMMKSGDNWVKSEKFFTPRHVSKIIDLFSGINDIDELVTQLNQIIAGNNRDQAEIAATLRYNYFGTTFKKKDGSYNSPMQSMNDMTGQAIATVIFNYIQSADLHVPGFSKLTIKGKNSSSEFEDTSRFESREIKYPTSSIKPNLIQEITVTNFLSALRTGNPTVSTDSVTINGKLIVQKDHYTTPEVVEVLKAAGLKMVTSQHIENFIEYQTGGYNTGDGVKTRKSLVDWVIKSTKEYKSNNKSPRPDAAFSGLVNQIIDDEGLGNDFSTLDMNDNRQYTLRSSNPTTRVKEMLREIDRDTQSVHKENVLYKSDSNIGLNLKMGPMINQGILIDKNGKESTKPLNEMSADELLDVYIVDGYVQMLSKGDDVYFPVTVYSDSNTEYMPSFNIKKITDTEGSLKDLFASRVSIYTQLEKQILDTYVQLSPTLTSKNVNELQAKLQGLKLTEAQLNSSPLFIKQLVYQVKDGVVRLNPDIVNQINTYKEENLTSQLGVWNTKVDAWVKNQMTVNPALVKKIKENGNRMSAEQYLKTYYTHWMVASGEYRAMFLGNDYQYKNTGTKQLIDLVKRSKALVAPGTRFAYRRQNWDNDVVKFKSENPNQPLPLKLFYEGAKLSRYANQAVIKEMPYSVTDFDLGTEFIGESWDGATFVTPFTRLGQKYSTGMGYGTFIGPVMKNVTPSKASNSIHGNFVKNAEFLITPEIMKMSSPVAKQMLTSALSSIPFNTPVNGTNNALELLISLGMSPDFSNVTELQFEQAYAAMVENLQQDNYIHELIPYTSDKTGSVAPNEITAPNYFYRQLDLRMKATQQDAMKDAEGGLATKPLTQLTNTLAINWVDDVTLNEFYDSIAEITKTYLDDFEAMSLADRQASFKQLMKNELMKEEAPNYRTETAFYEAISINDPMFGALYSEKIATMIKKRAIAYPMQGGQYVIHPANGLINRKLNYIDPVREDGLTLSQAYKTLPIEQVHASLQSDNWTVGEAEIMLPAEMSSEFMLEDAMAQGIPLEQISPEYFVTQLSKNPKVSRGNLSAYAGEVFLSFQSRLKGIITRIPTSGKHSAMVTRIVGFTTESMNSVFVPVEMLRLQGADQDIDKGSYLTMKSIVLYEMVNAHTGGGMITTLEPEKYPNMKVKRRIPTGLIPTKLNIANIEKVLPVSMNKERAKELNRIVLENTIIQSVYRIMQNPKTVVEANTPVDRTLRDLRAMRDMQESSEKLTFDDLDSLLRIHEMNQAGGKNITGIFANGSKAYNVMYTYFKLNKKQGALAGLEGMNEVWFTYAGLISATVDNANEGVLGPLGINNITAPYVSYLVSQGKTLPEIRQWIVDNNDFIQYLTRLNRYDSDRKFFAPSDAVLNVNPQLKTLHFRTEEWTALSNFLVNREIPTRSEDVASYILGLERFVNTAFQREYGKNRPSFSLERFVNEDSYAQDVMNDYDGLIKTTPDGGLDENSYHSYNILRAFREVPHIRQYQRAMIVAHKMSMERKDYGASYNILSRLSRNSGGFIESSRYGEIRDLVMGTFIHNYLAARDLSAITTENLSTLQGRKNFIAVVNGNLESLKSTYPNNQFVKLLTEESVQGLTTVGKRVRLPDFYEIGEDTKFLVLDDFKKLSEKDRKTLFIYNLIVTRDKNSKGSFSSFVSFNEKADFIEFLDGQLLADENALYDLALTLEMDKVTTLRSTKYDREASMAIPYHVNLPLSKAVRNNSKVVDGVNVIEVDGIFKEGKTPDTHAYTIEHVNRDNVMIPVVGISRRTAALHFNTLKFHRWPKSEDGTTATTIPMTTFTNAAEYIRFVETYAVTEAKNPREVIKDGNEERAEYIGEYRDRIAGYTFVKMNKQKPVKFKSRKQYAKEAAACKLS